MTWKLLLLGWLILDVLVAIPIGRYLRARRKEQDHGDPADPLR